ncbi:MAG: alpha/beta hydrolase [Acidobacteriia bacterium]|nr:alpha/beta hydrolase [Terriglobia bacterium]MYG01336.1 alpha/beta hydrolase [Terriglobia bacterium]MYK09455.1 alpha/beta hydrolase [Terriglobia bacterium]
MRNIARRTLVLPLVAMAASMAALGGQPPAPPAGWTDSFVMANGIRIHYWRTGGEKPVLVMLHGSSDDGLCWTSLAKELTSDYDVVLPDARGHGWSDPAKASDPADVLAEDVAALIRELKLDRPIVMGHSMGASSAAWFAAKYPDMARAIVLEDPGLLPRQPRTGRGTMNVEGAHARILARNQTSYDDLVKGCVESSPKWGLEECRIWAPSKRLHHPSNAYRYRTFAERPPMTELFAKIGVPTLILKADADDETRKKNDAVAAVLKSGRIVHIDGAGHNVRREEKAALLAALRDFLSNL